MAAGVTGTGDEAGEVGVSGEAVDGEGVRGVSHAKQHPGVLGVNDNDTNEAGVGVWGQSAATGVFGQSTTWHGVFGTTTSTTGGHGVSGDGPVGVSGIGRTWIGVYGESHAAPESGAAGMWGDGLTTADGVKGVAKGPGKAAVCGFHQGTDGDGGPAIFGDSVKGRGVHGQGPVGVAGIGGAWVGVYGETNAAPESGSAGMWGDGKGGGDGVKGVANGPGKAAVCGFQLGNNGPGIFGQGNPAGQFQGNVVVNGDLTVTGDVVLAGADVAEQFDLSSGTFDVPAGAVVVLDDDGRLSPCQMAYDSKVAGIVSGAGDRVPALVLDRGPRDVPVGGARRPVAVVGKAWCLADATAEPIGVGDLLTTSAREGHAMRAADRLAAFGAVIGKALTPLTDGTGHVLVLVGLG